MLGRVGGRGELRTGKPRLLTEFRDAFSEASVFKQSKACHQSPPGTSKNHIYRVLATCSALSIAASLSQVILSITIMLTIRFRK